MSPYSFNPKMAKKLLKNPHIDFGQGIINLIDEIHKSMSSGSNSNDPISID